MKYEIKIVSKFMRCEVKPCIIQYRKHLKHVNCYYKKLKYETLKLRFTIICNQEVNSNVPHDH